jgi:hypothetical protein
MYKECIMNEMEGKSIPYSIQQQQLSANNDDRSKTLDSLVCKQIDFKSNIFVYNHLD